MVVELRCGYATVPLELKILSRWKELWIKKNIWRIWKNTFSTQQWDPEHMSLLVKNYLHEDQGDWNWMSCIKPWLESNWKYMWSPSEPGGTWEVCQRRLGWNSSKQVNSSEPCYKLHTYDIQLTNALVNGTWNILLKQRRWLYNFVPNCIYLEWGFDYCCQKSPNRHTNSSGFKQIN